MTEPLDWGLISDISKSREEFEQFGHFHWDFYSELEYLRHQIYDSLKESLREKTKAFEFSGWQRAVKYKYSLAPLSTKGSQADPGGRFNIGAISPSRFPVFPALYLARDKKTALAEVLGRADSNEGALKPEELALTNTSSISIVSVSGKLESVLQIGDQKNLEGFVNCIKDFKLSGRLVLRARKLGLGPPRLIRTTEYLLAELQTRRWREWPTLFDVPSCPQIFGRIALDAGIEGILYTSVLTGEASLVVFPQCFQNSSAFVELDDPPPSEAVQKRIDRETYKNFL